MILRTLIPFARIRLGLIKVVLCLIQAGHLLESEGIRVEENVSKRWLRGVQISLKLLVTLKRTEKIR